MKPYRITLFTLSLLAATACASGEVRPASTRPNGSRAGDGNGGLDIDSPVTAPATSGAGDGNGGIEP